MDIWIPKDTRHPLEDDYSTSTYERNPHGLIYLDGKEVGNTLQCPHCGGHFRTEKGKMRLRCMRHNAKVCDNPICNTYCTDYYETVGHLSTHEI